MHQDKKLTKIIASPLHSQFLCPVPVFIFVGKILGRFMTDNAKLNMVKIIHTLIWLFFNAVIFYLLYAVIVNRMDRWAWICLWLILLECLTLVLFKMMCPLTLIARRYSESTRDNFDIFLPNWLAKYNKLIYGIIFAVAILLLIYRLT
jgi:hypothetical protein